ncbi:transporter [Insulibacter thermoxylanivorax]|uniref:Transporter n=1 Tax=Insulibacter thermoxylanivorax TaxID=2749268 RepID=A0A916VFW8_9BACL|nr:MgtC/SapB family protein [Insulibacter thermoxylanivorax]GFR37881.1 transporter [Insulibacter thermoxylanivorax]
MPEIIIDTTTIISRLLLSALLGGMIGWERERRNKQAGLKTHLLVSLGSSLIMLTSIYGFDPARLAAQVVSGIGFLGAGAILRRSDKVISGLTTAATLWVAAAIGLSVGSGFYVPAVAVTLLVLLSTLLLNRFEMRYLAFRRSGSLRIHMVTEERLTSLDQVTSILEQARLKIEKVHITDETADQDQRHLMLEFQVYAVSGKQFNQLFEALWKVEGIRDIRMNWRD